MKVLVAGDFCPQNRVAAAFQEGKYSTVLGVVKSLTNSSDYSIVNLECPVCYGEEKPIQKCGPNLCCTEDGIKALKWAGFDIVTLANNHFLDYGDTAVKNTLAICEREGIDTVGGGTNLKMASRVLEKTLCDKKLTIINCCEHEFSIATEKSSGSNPLNPVRQYYDIKKAKLYSDYIIVVVHGGNEYYRLPSPRMQEVYRFFIDAGADAVINHHQHCYSGFEIYNEKPIFYGLGNFCFDKKGCQRDSWYEGMLVQLIFEEENVSYKIIPYFQCDKEASINLMADRDLQIFYNRIDEINKIIKSDSRILEEYNKYLDSQNLKYLFEPYNNKYLLSLYKRHFLPSFLSEKKKTKLLAYLQCESHIVKLITNLKNRRL